MADSGTLATTAQVLLAIGANGDTAQVLEANTNIWVLYAEADMESAADNNIGLVANYSSITAANKQSLAAMAASRAAWYGIQYNQNSWSLATAQSKLNVIDAQWKETVRKLKDKDFIDDLGL